jgi:demethylmenaquinone methyltransferase/2-methoxy-6-polyprenyl-1,4-benzoquinol methylase
MSYVYMKVLESAPDRYDRGMRVLTLGRLEQVHQDIAAYLDEGDRALDVGCGTGALAAVLARRGVQVTGIDISPQMLSLAAQRVRQEGLEDRVILREMGAVDLDTGFDDGSFDAVTSTLAFSELSDDEIAYTMAECHRILRPGGLFLVADEVLPDSTLGRVGTFLLRLPFAIAAFVLTQNTTHRVALLDRRMERAGFRLLERRRYLAGTLQLFVAERVGGDV